MLLGNVLEENFLLVYVSVQKEPRLRALLLFINFF